MNRKKDESEATPTAAPYEKSLVPIPDEKLSLSKTLAIPEKDSDLAAEKKSGDPTDRGIWGGIWKGKGKGKGKRDLVDCAGFWNLDNLDQHWVRRDCLEAYHAECVAKDESFVESGNSWTCKWHSCFICCKSSKFHCFCCLKAVCQHCIATAEFARVRRNKGFCNHYLKFALLREENMDVNSDGVLLFCSRLSLCCEERNPLTEISTTYYFSEGEGRLECQKGREL
ncbi:hypothetical protein ACSBR1_019029 [Camellia fascicularis]